MQIVPAVDHDDFDEHEEHEEHEECLGIHRSSDGYHDCDGNPI
ncbi:hypothetical protein AB0E62_27400 [Streptomyces sp. NPDC038707]